MNADLVALALVDGLSYAGLLFLVSLGLTLIFGVLNILNVAHGSLYAFGGYLAAPCVVAWLKGGDPSAAVLLASLFGAALVVGVVLGALL